ncbi:hypothetical protein SmJEL517_g06041 [Synchytrium microbalum]|uniref:Uncharacterized protein n=1 Tax=Synchytrium microbalum TaxID=1806994 RepID=A0A507BTH4_9FUNG|nr:uncharacterized protein SmJEL517_g06041 [Synchytrium microbalum]TPX30389.1 hypothetical protein SmJEL517_g06041 [Synchytrium microbalum]
MAWLPSVVGLLILAAARVIEAGSCNSLMVDPNPQTPTTNLLGGKDVFNTGNASFSQNTGSLVLTPSSPTSIWTSALDSLGGCVDLSGFDHIYMRIQLPTNGASFLVNLLVSDVGCTVGAPVSVTASLDISVYAGYISANVYDVNLPLSKFLTPNSMSALSRIQAIQFSMFSNVDMNGAYPYSLIDFQVQAGPVGCAVNAILASPVNSPNITGILATSTLYVTPSPTVAKNTKSTQTPVATLPAVTPLPCGTVLELDPNPDSTSSNLLGGPDSISDGQVVQGYSNGNIVIDLLPAASDAIYTTAFNPGSVSADLRQYSYLKYSVELPNAGATFQHGFTMNQYPNTTSAGATAYTIDNYATTYFDFLPYAIQTGSTTYDVSIPLSSVLGWNLIRMREFIILNFNPTNYAPYMLSNVRLESASCYTSTTVAPTPTGLPSALTATATPSGTASPVSSVTPSAAVKILASPTPSCNKLVIDPSCNNCSAAAPGSTTTNLLGGMETMGATGTASLIYGSTNGTASLSLNVAKYPSYWSTLLTPGGLCFDVTPYSTLRYIIQAPAAATWMHGFEFDTTACDGSTDTGTGVTQYVTASSYLVPYGNITNTYIASIPLSTLIQPNSKMVRVKKFSLLNFQPTGQYVISYLGLEASSCPAPVVPSPAPSVAPSPVKLPSAGPSPTAQPSSVASPFVAPAVMPACSGVLTPLTPSQSFATSLLGGGQGIGVGTGVLTGGKIVLTPGANDYFYSSLYPAGKCFDASQGYAMLRIGVQMPPGGGFSVGVQLYDATCAANGALHYFGFSTQFGLASGQSGILTIPITPELSNTDLTRIKNIIITGFASTNAGATFNITGMQLDGCGVTGGSPCARDVLLDDFRMARVPSNVYSVGGKYNLNGGDYYVETGNILLNAPTSAALGNGTWIPGGLATPYQPDPTANPGTAPTTNYLSLRFEQYGCFDMTNYRSVMFTMQAPAGFDSNITFTQRAANCVARGFDSQYHKLSEFVTPNNQAQTVELPLSSFTKNLNGGNFDWGHTRDWTFVNANGGNLVFYKTWLKGTCGLGTPVALASPVAQVSPVAVPTGAAGPAMPACNGLINTITPGTAVNLATHGGQGFGFTNGGTATQANGVITLLPGALGNYFFSMLANTGCFNAQAYNVLRVSVAMPVGGSFSIAFDVYAADCTTMARTVYFDNTATYGVPVGGTGIVTIPLTPLLANSDLANLKAVVISGFTATGAANPYKIFGIQFDNCQYNPAALTYNGQTCQRDVLVDDFRAARPVTGPSGTVVKYNLLNGDYGAVGATWAINAPAAGAFTGTGTLTIANPANPPYASDPTYNPYMPASYNWFFFKFDPAACFDISQYTAIMFTYSVSDPTFWANMTLTQKAPDCTTRTIDSQYHPFSTFTSGAAAIKTYTQPLSSVPYNLAGGYYDRTHLKDFTFVNMQPANANVVLTLYQIWLKGTC